MSEPTVGETEDDRAFQMTLDSMKGERRIIHAVLPLGDLRQQLRYLWNAGMERGEEKRGCCHEPEPWRYA